MDPEQIAYYEELLAPYYNLDTGEPLPGGLSPFPTEMENFLSIKQAAADGVELYI